MLVNSALAARQETWFSAEVSANNSGGPVSVPVQVEDDSIDLIAAGDVALPKAVTQPIYDDAGNLASDGRWDYRWDSAGRLLKMTTAGAAQTEGFPDRKKPSDSVKTLKRYFEFLNRRRL